MDILSAFIDVSPDLSLAQVVWADTPRAALAGEILELPFKLSMQPVESVSVTLSCGDLLEVSNETLILTPLQSKGGDVFRLEAKDDGG